MRLQLRVQWCLAILLLAAFYTLQLRRPGMGVTRTSKPVLHHTDRSAPGAHAKGDGQPVDGMPSVTSGSWGKSTYYNGSQQDIIAETRFNWLDAITASQYPTGRNRNSTTAPLTVVCPSDWGNISNIGGLAGGEDARSSTVVVHVSWSPRSGSFYTSHHDDETVSMGEASGGNLQGKWPEQLSDLTVLTILKNGHTTLMGTLMETSRLLGGSGKIFKKRPPRKILRQALQRQRSSLLPGHVVFAIVRDPVERFICSTCQDLSMGFTTAKKVFQRCKGFDSESKDPDPLALMDCILNKLRSGSFTFHQTPQASILMSSVGDIPVGVTLIPMTNALRPLVDEIGGGHVKTRDRSEEATYHKSPALSNFCRLDSASLRPEQVREICRMYQADVNMLALANIGVPLCRM